MAKQNKSTGCGALVFSDTKAFRGWKVQKGYTQNLLIKGGLGMSWYRHPARVYTVDRRR